MEQRTKFALDRPRAYWLLGYMTLILFVGTTIPTPLYGVYQAQLHFSSGTLTLIFAVYVLALLPTLVLFGHASDEIGRRPVLLTGLAIAACAVVVFAAMRGLAWLFVARALQGFATGALTGTATAALVELQAGGDARKAALVASAANVGGAALGPLFAGLLAQYGPWPTTLSYLIYLALMLPAIAVVAIPETVVEHRPIRVRLRWPEVPLDIRREFLFASATSFTVWAATALYLTLAPTYVALLLHVDNLAVGGTVVFLMLGSSALAQMLLREHPFRMTTTMGLVLVPIGLVGVVLAVPLHIVSLLFAGTLIVGAGQGLAFMGSLSLVNQIAPADRRADVASSFFIITYLGVAIPIIGVGFGAQSIGLFPAVAIFSSLIGVMALTLAAASRRMMLVVPSPLP